MEYSDGFFKKRVFKKIEDRLLNGADGKDFYPGSRIFRSLG